MPQEQSNLQDGKAPDAATMTDTAGAVGVPSNRHWYVAIVNHGAERLCCDRLAREGYESYLPSQKTVRRYSNGRKKKIDRLVLPSLVFVRATEQERLKQIVNHPLVNRFLVDRARKTAQGSPSPAAIIPDEEMNMFRIMLNQEEFPVSIEQQWVPYSSGDKVRVTRGRLAGLEGTVKQAEDGKRSLYISLSILGTARVEIDRADIIPL